jgi:hypothetical protein
MKLFCEPAGHLRLTLEDRSYWEVVPVWAAPRTQPGKYLSLLDAKRQEIMMLPSLEDAGPENMAVLKAELEERYLHSRVVRINSVRTVFGSTYWDVETNRGHREFVTQSLQENAQWVNADFLLLVDVEGNQYHVKDISQMDARSQKLLHGTV